MILGNLSGFVHLPEIQVLSGLVISVGISDSKDKIIMLKRKFFYKIISNSYKINTVLKWGGGGGGGVGGEENDLIGAGTCISCTRRTISFLVLCNHPTNYQQRSFCNTFASSEEHVLLLGGVSLSLFSIWPDQYKMVSQYDASYRI